MPIGVILNALAVLLGGLLGALLGNKIPERLRTTFPLIAGLSSMSMGVVYILDMNKLPVVILSIVLGSTIGELIKLEQGIKWCVNGIHEPIDRFFPNKKKIDENEFMEKFIAIMIIFTASGTGIFGALNEGLTGDYSVLFAKSILDFFTAGIFAVVLGCIVMTLAIPQFIVLFSLFLTASVILPLLTPAMIADFTAVGGMVMLATGFNIAGIKTFPIGNMLPAMFLVIPISHIWTTFLN